VGYPIVNLRGHKQDLHWYLRQVEAMLMRALENFGVPAERSERRTGVWTLGRKIASIGVHARDWVTWHGFALNVTTDLSYFGLMVPCGIQEVTMTSVQAETALRGDVESPSMESVSALISESFGAVFDLRVTTSLGAVAAAI